MRFAPLFVLLLVSAACSSQPPADAPEPNPSAQTAATADPAASASPTADPSAAASATPSAKPLPIGPGANANCKLPAPKVSGDACKTDADCGVSEPCHAKACVGIANANPPKKDTMCTMSLMCDSADANRCGCLDGFCALIPPTDS